MPTARGIRGQVPLGAKAMLFWLVLFALVWGVGRLRTELPSIISREHHSHGHPSSSLAGRITWDADEERILPVKHSRPIPPLPVIAPVTLTQQPEAPPSRAPVKPPPARVVPPPIKPVENYDLVSIRAAIRATIVKEMYGPNGPLWSSELLLNQGSSSGRKLQQLLATLQQPDELCNHTRLLVHYSESSTLADIAHELALSLKVALLTGRTLVLDIRAETPFGSRQCNGSAFSCYFQPLGKCMIGDVWEARNKLQSIFDGDSTARVVTMNAQQALASTNLWVQTPVLGFSYRTDLWITGQLIAYAFRPSARTAEQVAEFWLLRKPKWDQQWDMMFVDDTKRYTTKDFRLQTYIDRYSKRKHELTLSAADNTSPGWTYSSSLPPPPRALMFAASYSMERADANQLPYASPLMRIGVETSNMEMWRPAYKDLAWQRTVAELYIALVAQHYFLPLAHPYGRLILELSYFLRGSSGPTELPFDKGLDYSVTSMDDTVWSLRA